MHTSFKNNILYEKNLNCCIFNGTTVNSMAQMPANTPANIKKYKAICREYIYMEMKGMYREPGGGLA
jgi:hypothetical protein